MTDRHMEHKWPIKNSYGRQKRQGKKFRGSRSNLGYEKENQADDKEGNAKKNSKKCDFYNNNSNQELLIMKTKKQLHVQRFIQELHLSFDLSF